MSQDVTRSYKFVLRFLQQSCIFAEAEGIGHELIMVSGQVEYQERVVQALKICCIMLSFVGSAEKDPAMVQEGVARIATADHCRRRLMK